MTGMNTLGTPELSDYQGRTVTIGVTGVCQQSVLKASHYEVRVPFSQMSQALKTINHQGGKVTSVRLMGQPAVTCDFHDNEKNADSKLAGLSDQKVEAVSPETESATQKAKRSSRRKRR